MSLRTVNEETPLLEVQKQKKARTPLPWRQFSIIMLLQLVEPLIPSYRSVCPTVRDIGITNGDEAQVGYYVGLLHSIFFATQALTVLHWSRLSDHIGRKPVALTGLVGLSLSMYCFGLSKSFWGLMMSRSLNGALNGNVGVIKSMMAEITDSTNLPQAYAYMPIAWSSGTTLGPYVGGSLSNPVDRFPDIFGDWEFFKTYPYFLACAIPATFSALTWLVTFVFLKETLPHRAPFGYLIKSKLFKKSAVKPALPDLPREVTANGPSEQHTKKDGAPLPLRELMVPRVLVAAGNYATLSLLEISFRAIQPLFFATPLELGGLGLDPPTIGNILSIFGVLNGLFQAFFFADLHDRFGSKLVYTVAIASGLPLILTFPLINTLARTLGLCWIVWSVIGLQLAIAIVLEMGFSCIFIYVAAAPPNRASLGATNGIAQLLVSIVRAVGPAAVTSLFSVSVKTPERAWFVYYFLLFLAFVGIGASMLLPRKLWDNSME